MTHELVGSVMTVTMPLVPVVVTGAPAVTVVVAVTVVMSPMPPPPGVEVLEASAAPNVQPTQRPGM